MRPLLRLAFAAAIAAAPLAAVSLSANAQSISSEQRGEIERQALVDHDDRAAIDHGVLGVARDAGLVIYRLAVEVQAMVPAQQLARGARRH